MANNLVYRGGFQMCEESGAFLPGQESWNTCAREMSWRGTKILTERFASATWDGLI